MRFGPFCVFVKSAFSSDCFRQIGVFVKSAFSSNRRFGQFCVCVKSALASNQWPTCGAGGNLAALASVVKRMCAAPRPARARADRQRAVILKGETVGRKCAAGVIPCSCNLALGGAN